MLQNKKNLILKLFLRLLDFIAHIVDVYYAEIVLLHADLNYAVLLK